MVTTGKIFKDSSNIYQDEAKMLFNYYRQAAERIVQEEERIEKQIAEVKEQKAQVQANLDTCWKWFLTVILFFMYFVRKKKYTEEIATLDGQIEEFEKLHKEIFRDYKVNKLGVMYVPVADQIKYEDKSFIVDYTGQVAPSQVSLQLSRQNDLLCETIENIKKLNTEAPIVESSNEVETVETDDYSTSMQEINQNDYFGKLDRSLRTISFCMSDLDTTSVSLPLVADKSRFLENINEYTTTQLPKGAKTLPVFDIERYQANIAKFKELNKLKDSLSNETNQFEDVLKDLMTTMANSVQAISLLKLQSTDKVVNNANNLLYRILKAPYNHYSPLLEAEEIQRIREEKFDYSDSVQGYQPFSLRPSSRVRYNLVTDMWTAEDGSTTSMPFGIHQIYEEIVAPMVERLMQENRVERLKVYNHIKDQKISYLNKWHQDTDEFYRANRAQSADLINLMQESLREYVAAFNTLASLQKTQDQMSQSSDLKSSIVNSEDNSAETILAFEQQAKQFEQVQNDFEDFMDRLKEDIDARADEFGHVEYYDARLQDGHSNEVAVASAEVQGMDERRKNLSAANPLLAKKSELPPTPNVEEITYEHLALNLPLIAKNALEELAEQESQAVVNQEDVEENEELEDINEAAETAEEQDEEENAAMPEENDGEEEYEEEESEEEPAEEEKIEEEEEEDDDAVYSVELTEAGANKDEVVAAILDMFDMDEADAQELIDEAPVVIADDLSKEDAQDLADALNEAGATAEVKKVN